MKYTKKNRPVLVKIIFLALLIGTFTWDLLERTLNLMNIPLHIALGPIGFDLHVVSCYLYINPGSLLGIIAAVILFRRL